jgi:hypothetical protein
VRSVSAWQGLLLVAGDGLGLGLELDFRGVDRQPFKSNALIIATAIFFPVDFILFNFR